jgi:hypothetical protein
LIIILCGVGDFRVKTQRPRINCPLLWFDKAWRQISLDKRGYDTITAIDRGGNPMRSVCSHFCVAVAVVFWF